MATRRIPVRTCVACRRDGDKRDLVRFVRDSDGEAHVDISGKAPGRGASVCPENACFETAVERRRLAAALRVTLDEDDIDRLRKEFEEALRTRAESPSRYGR